MKKILFIILLISSFAASAQVRQRDSTIVIRHNPPLNTLVPTYSFITPLYKEVMAAHNLAQDSMVVFNPITRTYGYRTIPSGGGGSPIDTSNKWITLIERTPGKDSIIWWKGGVRYAIKDSVGSGGGGTPAGGDNEIQVGLTGAFVAYDRFKFAGGSNISKLTIKEGSSQSTNHLTQWTTTADAVRTAITYDHKLMLTQVGGYNQYLGVANINSLPGSFEFSSYTGDFFGINVTSTDVKFLGQSTAQKFSYTNPVVIASGVADPLKITSSGGLTNFEAMQFGGVNIPQGMAIGYIEKTGTYTATTADHVINCTSGTFTVTLPLANTKAGLLFTIINTGAGAITVGTTSSQTINGSTTYSLATQYDWVTVISDGVSKWYIKSKSSSGGTTDLGYTASPTNGIVTISTGTDATIPLANATNAGLLAPALFDSLMQNKTIHIVTGPSGFDQSAYSPNDSTINLKADRIVLNGTNVTPTVTDTTRSWAINTITESTYTPTLFNTTNIAASTAYTTYYVRSGDWVTVWGEVDIDATAATTISEMAISLPVSCDITNTYQLAGTASFEDNTVVQIKGDATNNRAMLRFTPQSASNNKYSFHFTYKHITP